jgi:hypothetical protein
MLRHGKLKSWSKWRLFICCSKWPWPTKLFFYINSSFLSNCTKQSYLQQGNSVQGDYKHYENQTHFPKRSILFRSILHKGEHIQGLLYTAGTFSTRSVSYKDRTPYCQFGLEIWKEELVRLHLALDCFFVWMTWALFLGSNILDDACESKWNNIKN